MAIALARRPKTNAPQCCLAAGPEHRSLHGTALVALTLMLALAGCASTSTESAYNAVGRGLVGLHEDGVLVAVEKYALVKCRPPSNCYSRHYLKPNETSAKADDLFATVTDGAKTMVVTHVVSYEGRVHPSAAKAVPPISEPALPDHGAQEQDECQGLISVDTPELNHAGTQRPPGDPLRQVASHSLYNAYAAFEGYPYFERRDFAFYKCGHQALRRTGDWLHARLENAARGGAPYSHVIVIAMGWNNDQQESLGRFNRMLRHVRAAASAPDQTYRPLVVALSWPSVWFSNADFRLTQMVGHILSYPNKTNDADEIGYTLGAELVHDIVGGAVAQCVSCADKPTVAIIGHSLGARLLSRAVYSGLYVGPESDEKKAAKIEKGKSRAPDIYLGLQGAFSANRFVAGKGVEGSPYADLNAVSTRLVLTSGEADTANPLARFATGAEHAGGKFGLAVAKEHGEVFCRSEVACDDATCRFTAPGEPSASDQPVGAACLAATGAEGAEKRVAMIDVGSILTDYEPDDPDNASRALGYEPVPGGLEAKHVSAHNDVLDEETGRLIWALIRR